MTRKKQNETMEKLKNLRLELRKIENDISENQKHRAGLQKRLRDLERDDGAVIRAQAYLEKGTLEAEPSLLEDLRAASDRERILRKAAGIKNAEYEAVLNEASAEFRESVMPEFIEKLKKKMHAVKDYEAAWLEEEQIRRSCTDLGLKDLLPFINWPGINPHALNPQREALQSRLKQLGLLEVLQ